MKQELGISFKDFLTRIRISQAVRLMEDRELSINQIAEKVGYSNQHYFSPKRGRTARETPTPWKFPTPTISAM